MKITARVNGAPYGAGGELIEADTLAEAEAWARRNLCPGQHLTATDPAGRVVGRWACDPQGHAERVEV